MNSKQIKKLRRLVKPLQVEWLQSILPEDQGKVITVDNVEELMPDQTHAFGNRQMHLSFMSDKWVMKILKANPYITTYKELAEINEQQQQRMDFTIHGLTIHQPGFFKPTPFTKEHTQNKTFRKNPFTY